MLSWPPESLCNEAGQPVPFHAAQKLAYHSTADTVALLAGSQGGKCLGVDSLITMVSGERKRVCEVVPGDEVLSLGRNLRICSATVVASLDRGVQKLYRVRTASGRELDVTAEHPLLTHSGWWPAGMLEVGNLIGVPRGGGVGWVVIDDIEDIGNAPTWDLALEGTHNFIANDIFAHNTVWAPWWMAKQVDELGAGDYLAVTASYDLFKLKLLPAYVKVFCDILKIGRYWAVDKIIELRPDRGTPFRAQKSQDSMWGRIILRSAQAQGGLESATAQAVHADEAGQPGFTIESWRALTRRIYATQGRILVTSTLYDYGWLKQQLIDPVLEQDALPRTIEMDGGEISYASGVTGTRTIDLIQFDSIINPSFPKESWDDAKATMPEDEFEMFFRGRAARLRSLVYDVFDPERHTCESFDIPQHWPRYVGIDPVGDRIAATWYAWDRENLKLHCYREYCEPFGITTSGHVRNILMLSEGERIFGYVGGGPSERQARADWQGAGIDIQEPPVTDVWVQIQRVYSLLKTNNLVIHKCCLQLISEVSSMRRRKVGEEFTMQIVNKEVYHVADSMRYAIAAIAQPSIKQEIIYNPVEIA